ncbi:hypothetical protein [Burkholderia pseudomallei]|uniref:hypothetical protein n=1 Tax=Burkholderia pseudomallei TaxID=28450 RepID=UPI0004F5A094|nr:hypothetical protein [Burkholderia pseudomallei]AIP08767.1 hypothetical protein DP55_194 [Burkholderia pseudomallei]
MAIVTRNAARLIRAAVFAGLASFAVAPAAHAAKIRFIAENRGALENDCVT